MYKYNFKIILLILIAVVLLYGTVISAMLL